MLLDTNQSWNISGWLIDWKAGVSSLWRPDRTRNHPKVTFNFFNRFCKIINSKVILYCLLRLFTYLVITTQYNLFSLQKQLFWKLIPKTLIVLQKVRCCNLLTKAILIRFIGAFKTNLICIICSLVSLMFMLPYYVKPTI
jgi:hypothetical protein